MTPELAKKTLENDRKILADLDKFGAPCPGTRALIERERKYLEPIAGLTERLT